MGDEKNLTDLIPIDKTDLTTKINQLTDVNSFKNSRTTYIKSTKAGLQLLMMSLSSSLTTRVMKMRTALDTVEDKLFDPNVLSEMKAEELKEYYKIMMESNDSYISFIKSIMDKADWNGVEGLLLELDAKQVLKDHPSDQVNEVVELIVQKLRTVQVTEEQQVKRTTVVQSGKKDKSVE